MAFLPGWRPSLLMKFHGALLLSVLPLLLLQQAYVLPAMREQLREDRLREVRQLVEVGYHLLEAHEARVRQGELTPDEARRAAAALLEPLRYAGNEYYWINDLKTRLVMHPFLPQRLGQDMTGYVDRAGKPVFRDIVELARAQGEGPVEYLATRPYSADPIPKLSYVKLFAPWGWVLGTGVYMEDLDEEVAAVERRMWAALFAGAGMAALGGAYLSRRMLAPMRALADAAGEVARGNLGITVPTPALDEVGDLSRAFNAMVADVQRMLGEMAEVSRVTESDAGHIHRATDGLRQAAQEQSWGMQNVSATVIRMTQQLAQGAHQAELTARTAEANEQAAREGGAGVRVTDEKMKEIAHVVDRSARTVDRLTEWSEEVERAMELISDVADQTRVLAVNTSIEAMRAGEHGKGFAVVALEVRKLAEQARAAAERIRTLMRQSQTETEAAAAQIREGRARVHEGLRLSSNTAKALERIVTGAEEIQRQVKQTASAHAAEAAAGESLALSIHTLSGQAAEAAKEVEHITQAAEGLTSRARQLRERATRFQKDAPP
ncbi:methyl-accepting chemotaxis protein [Archangium primigenium]|uniref:methyl-accepting chemotaxis protein n=1 Tax=[Archangium] primigenium TaxID=2792470 RepID=UPI00195C8AE1|nr:methyl-accepting chemotaxis protein [Archangium primigenium]MBM7112233.1 methyl-accepting chemotaxis protein [Archangium primigenium]